MKLEEAIRSYKRFRIWDMNNVFYTYWMEINEESYIVFSKSNDKVNFTKEMILSNKYEIDE